MKHLNNEALLTQTHQLVKEERRINLEFLRHLKEISERRLYLERGYPSLFEMCMQEFKYSASAAQRRIEAMRLIKVLPEVEQKIEQGDLSLSVVAQVQTFFRQEAKNEQVYSVEEKLELLKTCENKSSRDVERELSKISPKAAAPEKTRWINEDRIELKLSVDGATHLNLEKLKHLLSHKNPHMTYEDLLKELAEMALDQLDPVRKEERTEKRKKTAAMKQAQKKASSSDLSSDQVVVSTDQGLTEVPQTQPTDLNQNEASELGESCKKAMKSEPIAHPLPTSVGVPRQSRARHIPAETRRKVWIRDQGRCTFTDQKTGHRCNSSHLVQEDHIHPFALGGDHDEANLRLFCAAHNQHRARQTWGVR